MKIVMLLSNGFNPDPRVAAEAVALKNSGHQVTIFAWDRIGQLPEQEDYHGVQIVRCRILSGYSRGPLQIFNFFKFWKAIGAFLQKALPEVIHCHDLDTLKAGVEYGKRHKIPVIYDAHESYPDMVAHLFPRPIVSLIRRMEKKLVPQAAMVITVGNLLAQHFRDLGAKNVVVVGNYKKLKLSEPEPMSEANPLKIIYVGGLNRDRLVAPLVAAIAGDNRFQCIIVGDGSEKSNLEALSGSVQNIQLTGFLPQAEARALIDQCHLLYYGIDATYPNNQYSTPNSLFMAMAAGRPVICTSIGEIARIVQQEHCGTVLIDLEAATIIAALEKYCDSPVLENQAKASLYAATSKYNWDRAAETLIHAYKDLEKHNG